MYSLAAQEGDQSLWGDSVQNSNKQGCFILDGVNQNPMKYLFLGSLHATYMELLSLNEPESMFQSTIGPAMPLFLRNSGIPTDNIVVTLVLFLTFSCTFWYPNDLDVCFLFA